MASFSRRINKISRTYLSDAESLVLRLNMKRPPFVFFTNAEDIKLT